MSDYSEQNSSAPPVTNPHYFSAQGRQSARMTGGGPLQWEPPTIEEAARLFPSYEMIGLLGRGGMGAVYKARQLALDRLVAIKLLPLEVSTDRDFADRFAREARTMAKLNHPNIIAVHDFGTTSEGHLFFCMEFVEGATLHAIIHEVGLDPDQALWLAGEICTALAYAHGKGVVHRDIKPANVMVDGESHVKVADFGLARLTDAGPELHGMTLTGMVMGTPDYMAPEQKRGMNVDHRADIYSLGVLLYEMVCREVPQGAFELPSRRTGCDQRLDAIVLKAMQQSPERRYQSTKEMGADVETAREPLPSEPVPSEPVPQLLAVVPTPGMPVHVPQAVAHAPVPRHVVPIPAEPVAKKSRAPLYAGIAAVVLGVIVAVGIALRTSKPKTVGEPGAPGENAPGEKPLATSPETNPTPAPGSETSKEQTVANLPEIKAMPEPPKGQPVASSPEVKPTPLPGTETPAPPPAANPQQSATQIWLAEQEPQWQAAFVLEVSAPFEKGMADLKKQYLSGLDAQLASTTRSGQLAAAVAFRDELQRTSGGGAPGEDDATTPIGLKAMRASYRTNFAILETERATRAKAVHARYDAILVQNQTLLTQRQRFDEAIQLRNKREELSAAWLKPPLPGASRPQPTPPTPEVKPIPTLMQVQPVSTGTTFVTTRTAEAFKDRPFENTLGMRFVPVPITGGPTGGQRVLFSIWETRRQDWEAMVNDKRPKGAKPPPLQDPLHPKADISWDESQTFCTWLTDHERKAGRLGTNEVYRLPGDHEWSCAVGIGDKEDPAKDPEGKSGKIPDVFPWGSTWPPPPRAGNFKGEEAADHNVGNGAKPIPGYDDGFPYTAPVGSYPANRFGIYDLGGNVWEYCEELFHPNRLRLRVMRGASFANPDRPTLLSSRRVERAPDARNFFVGFRVVVSAAGPGR